MVFAPLEVGDPFAGLARATSGHSDFDKSVFVYEFGRNEGVQILPVSLRPGFVDDGRMDPMVQKALKSRRQRRKRSNILRARVHEPQNSIEKPNHHCAEVQESRGVCTILSTAGQAVNIDDS